MSSIGNQGRMNRHIDRLGIVRIALVQVLVLLALAGAAVWYVNWSSDVAWREFVSANQPPGSSPNPHRPPVATVHAVKGKTGCARRI